MAEFKHCESYKHLLAKNLLVDWLRRLDNSKDGCTLGQIYWRSNYGVFSELPFYETSNPYYFELSVGLNHKRNHHKNYDLKDLFVPGFNKGKILFVPDICIFHKGAVRHFIEVVHKSEPSAKKMDNIMKFFYLKESGGCDLWTISADHILGQVKVPYSLNFEHFLKID